MKTKFNLISMFLIILAISFSSCAPLIFKADFDSDSLGFAPNINPPGSPSGDEIILDVVGEGCHYTVENSSVFDSKALKFTPVDIRCIGNLRLVSTNVEYRNTFLSYYFELYQESIHCLTWIVLQAPISEERSGSALRIKLENGELILFDGNRRPRNIGTYSANQKLIFLVGIDRTSNTATLTILRDGMANIVQRDRPLYSPVSFWHHEKYELHISQLHCSPSSANRAYFIDNIRIGTKEEE